MKLVYKIIPSFLLFIITHNLLFAFEKKSSGGLNNFSPHLSTPSRTVGPGKWTFQPTAGYAVTSTGSLFLNNLSYGINHRYEIGTVPLLLISPPSGVKIYPLTLKVSLHESKDFDFGFTLTYIKYDFSSQFLETSGAAPLSLERGSNSLLSTATSTADKSYRINATFQVPQINFIWRMNLKNQMGFNYAYKFSTFKVDFEKTDPKELNVGNDLFIDFLHSPGNQFHYGLGYSHTHDIFSKPKDGVGVSMTLSRRGKFLSAPRIGVHHYNNGESLFLISSSFY